MNYVPMEDLPKHILDKIKVLKEGNRRFLDNNPNSKNFTEQRENLLSQQEPNAIILTCSDSRIAPHYIFDSNIGELFIVRDAGNVISNATLGSIEYSVEYLKTNVLIVLGHSSCGAVQATIADDEYTPSVFRLTKVIKPAVDIAKTKHSNQQKILVSAIQENVKYQIERAYNKGEVIRKYLHNSELAILGAYYDLETGEVNFWDNVMYYKKK